jgi:hypothetical protein
MRLSGARPMGTPCTKRPGSPGIYNEGRYLLVSELLFISFCFPFDYQSRTDALAVEPSHARLHNKGKVASINLQQ